MALYRIITPTISVAAATKTTLVQIAVSSSKPVKVKEVKLAASSVTAADLAGLFKLILQTTAGTTPTGTITPALVRQTDPAALCTVAYGPYATEPTDSTMCDDWVASPIGLTLVDPRPLKEEPEFSVSTRFALTLIIAQAETGVYANILIEE